MQMLPRSIYDQEHEDLRSTVRAFIQSEVTPHVEAWETAGIIDRSMWLAAGKAGLLGINAPEDLGGGGNRRHPLFHDRAGGAVPLRPRIGRGLVRDPERGRTSVPPPAR